MAQRRSDDVLIEEGRRIVTAMLGKSNWDLGDLGLEFAGPPGMGLDRLNQYSEEIGADPPHMVSYRAVAYAWPANERNPEIPWVCFRDLYRREDRHTVMTAFIEHCRTAGVTRNHYRQLQRFDGRKATPQFTKADQVEQGALAMESMPAEEAARIAQDALSRPDVLAALPKVLGNLAKASPEAVKAAYRSDPALRRAVGDVQAEEARALGRMAERAILGDPNLRHLDEQAALSDLTAACSTFATQVEAILPRLGQVPPQDAKGLETGARHFLNSSIERAEEALHNARSFLQGGKTDIDNFIGSVLGGR